MIFNNEAERMQHPQGRIIPNSLWNSFFRTNELSEELIQSMQATDGIILDSYIAAMQPQLKYNDDKARSWLCLILSHTDVSFEQFDHWADQLSMSPELLFQTAAAWGNKDYFQHLITMHEIDGSLQSLIAANNYFAYQQAAEQGHLLILTCLESNAPQSITKMIRSRDYEAFLIASRRGHLSIIQHFMDQLNPKDQVHMISDGSFSAFIAAAQNGRLDILNYLVEQTRDLGILQNMLSEGGFTAFRWAAMYNQHDTVNYLLNYTSLFAYAEENKYNQYVLPIIDNKIKTLRAAQSALKQKNPSASFDIESTEESQFLFYILRSLIRLNNQDLDKDILFLLEIPSVRSLAHTAVSPHKANELLTVAQTVGNKNAAIALLRIEAVFDLARYNHFYEKQGTLLDLKELANEVALTEQGIALRDNIPTIHFIWIGTIIPKKSDTGPRALADTQNSRGNHYPIIYWVENEALVLASDLFKDKPNIEVKSINEAINQYCQNNDQKEESIRALLQQCKDEKLPTVAKELLSPIIMSCYSGYFLDTSIQIIDPIINLPTLTRAAIPRNFYSSFPFYEILSFPASTDLYAYYSSPNVIDPQKSSEESHSMFTFLAEDTINTWASFLKAPFFSIKLTKDSPSSDSQVNQLLRQMVLILMGPISRLYRDKNLAEEGCFRLKEDVLTPITPIEKLPELLTIDCITTSHLKQNIFYINGRNTNIGKIFSSSWAENFKNYLKKMLEIELLIQKSQERKLVHDIQKIIEDFRERGGFPASANSAYNKIIESISSTVFNEHLIDKIKIKRIKRDLEDLEDLEDVPMLKQKPSFFKEKIPSVFQKIHEAIECAFPHQKDGFSLS